MANASGRFSLSGASSVTNIHLTGANSALLFAPDTSLTNTTILFEGSGGGTRSIGMNGAAGTVTFASTVNVVLAPSLAVAVTLGDANMTLNSSAIISNNSTRAFVIGPASFTNSGILNATSGSTGINATSWTNPGSIVVGASGTFNIGSTVTPAAIGSIQNNAGGTVQVVGLINNVGSTLNLNATTGSWSLPNGTINGGTVNLTGGSTLTITNAIGTLTASPSTATSWRTPAAGSRSRALPASRIFTSPGPTPPSSSPPIPR